MPQTIDYEDNSNNSTALPELQLSSADSLLLMRCTVDVVSDLIHRLNHKLPIDVNKIKHQQAARYQLKCAPKLVDIIAAIPEEYRKKLQPFVTAKPIRSASGVSVFAVMCKPHRCPHIALTGNVCIYCPVSQHFQWFYCQFDKYIYVNILNIVDCHWRSWISVYCSTLTGWPRQRLRIQHASIYRLWAHMSDCRSPNSDNRRMERY